METIETIETTKTAVYRPLSPAEQRVVMLAKARRARRSTSHLPHWTGSVTPSESTLYLPPGAVGNEQTNDER